MADDPKRLARLLRIQTQLNNASKSHLAHHVAENLKLKDELKDLNDLIDGDNVITRVFPQIGIRRLANVAQLEGASSVQIDRLAKELGLGMTKTRILQKRLDRSDAKKQRKNQERDFLERLARASADRRPVSRKA